MRRLISDPRIRTLGVIFVTVGLIVAVVLQRQTVFDALRQIRSLPARTAVVLAALAVVERVSRAEVIRSLLPELTLARSEMVSDIGSAASKGIPAGGPVATVLRWQIARERGVGASRFIVMLIASGVATAFVSWGYPLVATVVDMVGRDGTLADLGIIAVCAVVIGGSAIFWSLTLRSERAHRYVINRSAWILSRWPAVFNGDAADDADDVWCADGAAAVGERDEARRAARLIDEIRDGLRSVARRPAGLFGRTLIAQGTGAVILWVTLQGLGVGAELSVTEFARVFFVAHILGSLAPTPGGVGVIEAGVTGALVAAGVATDVALAGVLVYRFITYVLPIVVGTVWYLVWRGRVRRVKGVAAGSGPEVDWSKAADSARSGGDALH